MVSERIKTQLDKVKELHPILSSWQSWELPQSTDVFGKKNSSAVVDQLLCKIIPLVALFISLDKREILFCPGISLHLKISEQQCNMIKKTAVTCSTLELHLENVFARLMLEEKEPRKWGRQRRHSAICLLWPRDPPAFTFVVNLVIIFSFYLFSCKKFPRLFTLFCRRHR